MLKSIASKFYWSIFHDFFLSIDVLPSTITILLFVVLLQGSKLCHILDDMIMETVDPGFGERGSQTALFFLAL